MGGRCLQLGALTTSWEAKVVMMMMMMTITGSLRQSDLWNVI